MEFNSTSVNNCYILGKEVFNTKFFAYINAKAIYSASIFHLAFFKGKMLLVDEEAIKAYEKLTIKLYRLNSPYLYVPFEINFHENILYQAYYESDHFPLSVWLEEKILIPFNVLIQIMSDILNGIKSLENVGHSHLFLTPEEILVPLKWGSGSHVRIYNIGLNTMVHSVLDDDEIAEYLSDYKKNKRKSIEKTLIINISEDLFSFAKIISKLIPFCIFDTEKDKKEILGKLNLIIDKPDSFKSIDDVMILFNHFFDNNKMLEALTNRSLDHAYTGKAGFNISEFDKWIEEAKLEPVVERYDTMYKKSNKSVDLLSVFKLLPSFITRVLKRKKKFNNVSKETEAHSVVLNTDNPTGGGVINRDTAKKVPFTKMKVEQSSFSDLQGCSTEKILKDIERHYQKTITNNQDKILYKDTQLTGAKEKIGNIDETVNEKTHRGYIKSSIMINDKSQLASKSEFLTHFNKSLSERDYSGAYYLIKETKNNKYINNKHIISDMSKLIDNKIKHLDAHYNKDNTVDILFKLAKLDSIRPVKGKELSKDIITNILLEEKKNKGKKMNLFLRFVFYIKSVFKKIFTK